MIGGWGTISRLFVGALLLLAMTLFVLWRTGNPALEEARLGAQDYMAPSFESVASPTNAISRFFSDLRSVADLQAENARLRAQVARLMTWRDEAQRLEEENAKLRALNAVKPPPRRSFVTAEIIGDSGGPYAQAALVNAGRSDGVRDGAAAMDARGLAGRVVGAGENSARVLLLTDPNSRLPVLVGEERARAILRGDNTENPSLDFLFAGGEAPLGARVVTSGDGGVFPAGLHVGRVVALDADGPRVRLAADYSRLDFLRLMRSSGLRSQTPEAELIIRSDAPE